MPPTISDMELTDREAAIARHAADLAVKHMTETFYAEVGRTVVKRFFIIIGAIIVAFSVGKGWINLAAIIGK
jgi:hypothetical protein